MSAAYDQKKIDALASELMEPQRLAGGGAIRRLAEALKKKPVDEAIKDLSGRNEIDVYETYGDDAIEQGWSDGSNVIVLDKIYIDPENRGQGIGRQILSKKIEELAEQYPGYDLKLLAEPLDESTHLDKLIEFYESIGFDVGDYQDGMSGVPMEMTLRSKPKQLAGGGAIRKAAEAVRQAADSDLDMSTEARMQRAEEQNYLPETFYHATSSDFEEFVPKYADQLTFLTPNVDFANKWLGKGGSRSKLQAARHNDPIYLEYKAEGQKVWDKYQSKYGDDIDLWPEEEQQNYFREKHKVANLFDAIDQSIYPLRTNVQNTFDPRQHEDVIAEYLRSTGRDPSRTTIERGLTDLDYYKLGNYLLYENPEMVRLLKDKGFDSMRLAESTYDRNVDPVFDTLAIFNPSNIRSVNAAFDPAKRESSNILSGLGAGAVGLGALTSEDDPEGMSKGGLVDKLRSAASSVKEAGNVYKAAVGNMFSPFEPTEPQLGDPNDYEFPELRLRRPGIVNLALGMPNMPADMRYLYGDIKDAVIGDDVPDEEWRTFDTATEAQGRYEDDMDAFLRAYTGKSVDELSAPMSAVLGVSEALAQPGIISARAVEKLPRLARYLSNITEFATPVTVASPGAMTTGAVFNAGIRTLPALTDDDELKQIYNSYLDQDLPNKTGRDLTGREQAGLNKYLQELLGKKDGGLIDRINQGFYENISKPAVGTAIDMTLGLGDLAQMAARYLGNKAGFDAGEFTSVAQPVKEAIGVDDYNPYTIGGVGASILPFAAAGRTAQAINAAPAGVRQIQAALPNLGRESAAYVGAEAAGAGAREFMPDSPMAEVLASVAGGMSGSALGSQPTSMGIIKDKGGNWLAGSIEDELGRLHIANQGMMVDTPAMRLAEMERTYTPRYLENASPELKEKIQRNFDYIRSKVQIDNWIDSKLNKYIRNEMATEADPIRLQLDAFEGQQAERLAQKDAQIARAIDNMERARLERGRTPEEMTRSQEQIRQLQRERALIAAQTGLHADPEQIGFNRYRASDVRRSAGYPFVAQSKVGEAWEDTTDTLIDVNKAGDLLTETESEFISPEGLRRMHEDFVSKNPWLAKIPPESNVYSLRSSHPMDYLGFDHMMDELRNATRPDSDLPDNLRIDPNNLSKMSVPQIVQKIDEINAYRDVQRIEADALKAFNAATIPHRDYETIPYTNEPNVEGLRWVQIAVPQTLPEGYRVDPGDVGYYRIVDDQGNRSTYGAETEEEAIRMFNQSRENDPLRDALKYEGDAMGHCVGGYCDEVRDGATRIFSLRDARGRPHATVEVQDVVQGISGDILNKIEPGIWNKIIADNGYHDGGYEWLRTNRPDILQKLEARPTQKIEQIKGIRNAAPASQYEPFVQDFVKSGQWSEVGDLRNTGLFQVTPGQKLPGFSKEIEPGYYTLDEFRQMAIDNEMPEEIMDSWLKKLQDQRRYGYKTGGAVTQGAPVYNPDAINALAAQLMEPVKLSEGGPPPRSRIARAAAAVRGATTPPREVPDKQKVSDDDFAKIARDLGVDVDETDVLTDMPIPSMARYTAADRAAAGNRAASLISTQHPIKASEALGRLMEQGFRRTSTTQADRTMVGDGNIGGPNFPVLGMVDPEYADRSWGVMNQGTATNLMRQSSPQTAWTTLLGSADQLKSNQLVFDELRDAFVSSMRQGNLTPELESKYNQNLRLIFGEDADIRDPEIWSRANTFAKRAAFADILMGKGLGGEKSGKGVIFNPSEILKRQTEPSLLHPSQGGTVPTYALGPRMFTIEDSADYRPDLHPSFPMLLRGRDLGLNVIPTPTEVYLPDWHRNFREVMAQKTPPRKAPAGRYDLASGLKGQGLPSQELTDEYIRHLIREGFSQGGLANYRDMIRSN